MDTPHPAAAPTPPPAPAQDPKPPGPPPGSDDARALAIALQDQVLKAWDIYIKFYTVFHTVNFVALGLVVEKVHEPWSRLFIAAAFVAQNATSSVTGLAMGRYTKRVAAQQEDLGFGQLVHYRKAGWWGGLGNALGHWVISVLWILLVAWAFVHAAPDTTTTETQSTTMTTTSSTTPASTTTTTTSTTTSTTPGTTTESRPDDPTG